MSSARLAAWIASAAFALASCRDAELESEGQERHQGLFAFQRRGAVEVLLDGGARGLLRSICATPPCASSERFTAFEAGPGVPPGGLGSRPTASTWSDERIDLFALGRADRALWHQTFHARRWTGWYQLGAGPYRGAPAAVSWVHGRIDVYVVDKRGAVVHRSCEALGVMGCRAGVWSDWVGLPGRPPPGATGDVAVATPRRNRADLAVRGRDGGIWLIKYDERWGEWTGTGGQFESSPALTAHSETTVLFAADAAGTLFRATRHRNKLSAWSATGVQLGTQLTAVEAGADDLVIGMNPADGVIQRAHCDASGTCKKVD